MALLGSTVDPRLFVQDYSGFTRAADIQAQSMANIGANVGSVIKGLGEDYKDKKQLEAGIKATVTGIESAIKMGKSLGIDVESSLTPYLDKINDPNVSPIEAAAYAQQASNSISNVLNFGMKANEMGIEKERYKQATAARIAELKAEANRPGAIIEVNTAEGTQQMVRNPQTGVLEPIRVAGQPTAAGIESALGESPPMDIPTIEGLLVPANEGVISPDGTTVLYRDAIYTVDTGVLPARTPNEQAASIDAGLSALPTKGPIGFKPAKTDKPEIRMTAKQVQDLAVQGFRVSARPIGDGIFMVSGADIGGQAGMTIESDGKGGFKMTQGSVVGGGKAEAAKNAVQNKIDKAIALTQDLNLLEDRMQSMAPGVLGAAGRAAAQQIPGTFQAENKEIIDRVAATLTLENLQAMRNNNPTGAALGNVSDKDTALMRDSATALRNAQTPEAFKRELVRLKNLQHDVVYGSERVLKNKLSNGEIDKSQFDAAMAAAPSEYLNDRGVITARPTIPAASSGGVGLDQGAQDVLKEYIPR